MAEGPAAVGIVGSGPAGLAAAVYLHGRYWRWRFCAGYCPIGIYYSAVQTGHTFGIQFDEARDTCKDCDSCKLVCPVGLDPRHLEAPKDDIGGVAIDGFSSVGYSGPEETPNTWANIFAQLVGPVAPDGIMGACGPFDRALDLAFGPDPLPCDQRDGPVPNSSGSTPTAPGLPAGGSPPTAPEDPTGAVPATPDPSGGANQVGSLLAPLLATGGSS